jgi:hypothetical protein
MKYWGPINSAGGVNGNDPYVNGDPGAGVEGSIPSFQCFEQTLRELTNLVVKSGLTPSAVIDGLQIAQAVRSQTMNYRAAGGTANALTVTLDPAITAHIPGLPLRIKPVSTNTGPATLNEGAGSRPILRYDGTALAGGEIVADIPFEVIDAGTSWVILSGIRYGVGSGLDIRATPGAFTFTVPAGITSIDVQGWGGGGGGGGTGSVSNGSCGGGGAGGYFFKRFTGLTPGAVLNGSIGAAGTAGLSGGAGTAGGSTTFAGSCTAGGGGGGQPNSGSPDGGSGGSASGGDVNVPGGAGASGVPTVASVAGGAGGGASAGGPGGSGGAGTSGGGVVPGGGGAGRGSVAAAGGGGPGAAGMIIIRW